MNIFLWILQVLIALHTAVGAAWKFSNSAASAQLDTISEPLWKCLGALELIASVILLLPLLKKRFGRLTPPAALFIAAEMVLFCAVQVFSGESNNAQLAYWIVVALLCCFLAYGRNKLKPVKP